MHPKHLRIEDIKYLKWIRTLPCLHCGCHAEPHHCWSSGGGNKHNDYLAIPLCREAHTSAHRGEESWQVKTGLYYDNEVTKMLIKYIQYLRDPRPEGNPVPPAPEEE